MARTFKKQPKSERQRKIKQDNFRKSSIKRSINYDLTEDENE